MVRAVNGFLLSVSHIASPILFAGAFSGIGFKMCGVAGFHLLAFHQPVTPFKNFGNTVLVIVRLYHHRRGFGRRTKQLPVGTIGRVVTGFVLAGKWFIKMKPVEHNTRAFFPVELGITVREIQVVHPFYFIQVNLGDLPSVCFLRITSLTPAFQAV